MIRQIIRCYGVKKEAVTLYYINPCPTKMTPEKLTFHHEQPCIDKVLGINDVYAELVGRLEKSGRTINSFCRLIRSNTALKATV
ncbi:MAG: hypothetical protein HC887_09565 [Desulfobacteraceae bacterium]|nr:hypothetical protein [Desulfobacteraceae bacterium]